MTSIGSSREKGLSALSTGLTAVELAAFSGSARATSLVLLTGHIAVWIHAGRARSPSDHNGLAGSFAWGIFDFGYHGNPLVWLSNKLLCVLPAAHLCSRMG